MLFETKGKLADHKAGRYLLEDEVSQRHVVIATVSSMGDFLTMAHLQEKEKLEKRVELMERKLEKLEEVDEEVSRSYTFA